MAYSYAWQKAHSALSCLTSKATADSRLIAAGSALCGFPFEHLPLDAAIIALETMHAFSKWPSTDDFPAPEGTCAALIELLPDCRKDRLSEKVVSLFQKVCEAVGAYDAGLREPGVGKEFQLASPEKWEFLYWNLGHSATLQERATYVRYAQHWLPNIPGEVLLEWLGRHGYESMHSWPHLDLEALNFEEVSWNHEQLLKVQALDSGYLEVGPDSIGAHHLDRKGDWIGEYIKEHGTWSAPIIVIESPAEVPRGTRSVPAGLVLIEGHCRLSRLLNLPAASRKTAKHRVMLARVAQT